MYIITIVKKVSKQKSFVGVTHHRLIFSCLILNKSTRVYSLLSLMKISKYYCCILLWSSCSFTSSGHTNLLIARFFSMVQTDKGASTLYKLSFKSGMAHRLHCGVKFFSKNAYSLHGNLKCLGFTFHVINLLLLLKIPL